MFDFLGDIIDEVAGFFGGDGGFFGDVFGDLAKAGAKTLAGGSGGGTGGTQTRYTNPYAPREIGMQSMSEAVNVPFQKSEDPSAMHDRWLERMYRFKQLQKIVGA